MRHMSTRSATKKVAKAPYQAAKGNKRAANSDAATKMVTFIFWIIIMIAICH